MFCFNTILSDLSAHYPHVRNKIVKAQVELLKSLTNEICKIGYKIDYHQSEQSEVPNGSNINSEEDEEKKKKLIETKGCFLTILTGIEINH